MSAISEKVRIALYAKLNVSGVYTLTGTVSSGVGKIFESIAPDDTALPYVIFQRFAPEPVVYSFGTGSGPTQQLESDLWLIKAVTDEDSDTTKGPQKLAEDILAACVTALGTSLTLSGNTAVWYAKFADITPYREQLNDRTIFHHGFLWKVQVT
jgi:hypothetical protein